MHGSRWGQLLYSAKGSMHLKRFVGRWLWVGDKYVFKNDKSSSTANIRGVYIYIYMLPPPLTYPRFVLELSGIVIVPLQIFAISTVLGHM